MRQQTEATPQDYHDIFEVDVRGQRILSQLWRVFAKSSVTDGGIDAVLKTFERMGQRNVLEFLVRQINRANGVEDMETNQGEDDET